MKPQLKTLLKDALATICQEQAIELDDNHQINIDNARDKKHGDYASNIAMTLSKPFKKAPKQIAQLIIEQIQGSPLLEKVEIAGPGFINFFIAASTKNQVVHEIFKHKLNFGHNQKNSDQKVILEYVSANPTGPLHVGHGRGTAIGATLANILKSQGYNVHQEYYVNDAGRQMNILAASVYLRYLEMVNEPAPFPVNGYKGRYVIDIAKSLYDTYANQFVQTNSAVFEGLPQDANIDDDKGGDKEVYIDAIIERIQTLIGIDNFAIIHKHGLDEVLQDIQQDLSEFGVTFDNYFSENSLFANGDIDKGIDALKKGGFIYEQEGAIWFKSTEFGDEKDRVLKRANGITTYFASDVAYHWNKYDRGFTQVIDVFGADHHGYVARVKAAATALGFDEKAINVMLIQFAILYRGTIKVPMSTRSGDFVTLRQLREEVGNDAARFFYVMRKYNQHLDFDLELAKSKSSENPVYYIQYAHARVSSVFRTLAEQGHQFDEALGLESLEALDNAHEQTLLNQLQKFPEMLTIAARDKEPHLVAYYLRELANQFHTYYNAHHFIVDNVKLRNARLCLIVAVQSVLNNGLSLIGVSSPEKM